MRKKLFIISSRVPFPLDKGDKLRLYHQLRFLKDEFEIMLCSLDDDKTNQDSIDHLKTIIPNIHVFPLSKIGIGFNLALGAIGRKPYQSHYFYQSSVSKKIQSLIKDFNPDHIYCQLIRSAEYVKELYDIPKTIDFQDAFSLGMERRIENGGWKKWFIKSEHQRLIKYEHIMYDYFDSHTIISEADRDSIFHEKRNNIKIVPNGIDSDFFRPKKTEKKYDLVFVGNMSYAPNVDSAIFIAREILPLLKKVKPEIKILIAGSSPHKEVQQLASKNIFISGWIDDIRDAYNQARIFIAPMNIGSGLQNKLLEAMSMELPCITSELANRSLQADNRENVYIAKNPKQYVEIISMLLANDTIRNEMGKRGRDFVTRKFSWKVSTELLAQLIRKEYY